MVGTRTNRRTSLRYMAIALATGGASTLAGCGDPGDGDGEDEDDGGGGLYREDEVDGDWGYREDGLDPGSENDAGTSAGGSSAG